MEKPIVISKKGDDGHSVISVRIKNGTLQNIDKVAKISNRSRNEIINILLESFVNDVEIY
ncbi:MAG: CopG family transcriptional regulator [Clostridia bacterium]|nr:CopG family transcriptional regulator [Clostridia bacterium]